MAGSLFGTSFEIFSTSLFSTASVLSTSKFSISANLSSSSFLRDGQYIRFLLPLQFFCSVKLILFVHKFTLFNSVLNVGVTIINYGSQIVKWRWKNKKNIHRNDFVIELSYTPKFERKSSLWMHLILHKHTKGQHLTRETLCLSVSDEWYNAEFVHLEKPLQ